jgi:transposase InsO family protein
MEDKIMSGSDEDIGKAFDRYQLIADLVNDNAPEDPAEVRILERQIADKSGLSVKTIKRYVNLFIESQLEGLSPKRTGRPGARVLTDEAVNFAAMLRKENPKRGLRNIIRCTELQFGLKKGDIKRSTMSDRLAKLGATRSNLDIAADDSAGPGGQRFQRENRNALWQSDFKHGIYVGGKKTYLISFIDDATRLVTHAEFCHSESIDSVFRCFRAAIEKNGKPNSVYFDNGSPFRSKAMLRAVSELGIKKIHCKAYCAKSKGKIEKYQQLADKFIGELAFQKVFNLPDLNYQWSNYLHTFYQDMSHSALGMTPLEAWSKNTASITFVNKEKLDNAFLRIDRGRKVDKAGCINFLGKKYFAANLGAFIGQKVDVIYDPIINKTWIVPANGIKLDAMLLKMKEFLPRKTQRNHLNLVEKQGGSQLLAAAEKDRQNKSAARERFCGLNNGISVSEESHAPLPENVEETRQPEASEFQQKHSGIANDHDSRDERRGRLIDFRGLNLADGQAMASSVKDATGSINQAISFRACLKGEGDN